jgi:hypothetical protein
VSQLESGSHVGPVEHIFHRDLVGRMLGYEAQQLAVDSPKPLGKRVFRGERDGSGGHQAMVAAVAIDDTKASSVRSAIDAQDSHSEWLAPTRQKLQS